MDEEHVVDAIERARKGIARYIEIMELFPNVNVARNEGFRRKFNAFYRVRQRSPEWYEQYYSSMQRWREGGIEPSFDDVLDHLHKTCNRYEPSFSSKLIATLDPNQPVWDKYVLERVLEGTETKVPSYASKNKFGQAKAVYSVIQEWYKQFLNSCEGKLVIAVFDREVLDHAKITDVKKVDFVLWQIDRLPHVISLRGEQCPQR